MTVIAVLDYEIGNLRSAQKALQHLGAGALERPHGRAEVPRSVVEDDD